MAASAKSTGTVKWFNGAFLMVFVVAHSLAFHHPLSAPSAEQLLFAVCSDQGLR